MLKILDDYQSNLLNTLTFRYVKNFKLAKRILRWSVDIREGEIGKTLLISLFFFLVIFALTVVKPVRNSLFLSELGAAKLPYMYLATAALTGILVLIDSKLSGILNRGTFMSTTIGFLLLNLLVFWWLVKLPEKWVTPTFYIWSSFFNYFLVAHFWGFANDFFNPRESKRLFGFILTMGTFGGIAGGLAADLSVETIFSTEDVLLLAAAALLLSIGLVQLIERHSPRKTSAKEIRTPNVRKIEDSKKTPEVKHNRHLALLGMMVVFGVIVSTLIDYQFNWIVEKNYTTKMAKTGFFGEFFALLNIISLFMQFFLTSKVLNKFGIGATLALVPIILAIGSAGFVFLPTILLASVLKISDKTLGYSLMHSSRELLFLPIPSEIRVKAKLLIKLMYLSTGLPAVRRLV